MIAQTAAAISEASQGRFALGLGTSSRTIATDWNAVEHNEPYWRMHDVLHFLRAALAGERVSREYRTFSVSKFNLARPPAAPPPLLVAALGPAMLKLAGRDADGVILNWLGHRDISKVLELVADGGEPKEVVCRVMVCPTSDADAVRAYARPIAAGYLSVPAYAAFQRRLGRGGALEPMWQAWANGDRKRAAALVPDEVVDELVVHGTPAHCRTELGKFFTNGVTTLTLALLPLGPDALSAAALLGPERPTEQHVGGTDG